MLRSSERSSSKTSPSALAFVNRVGELAETEDHHPEIHIDYSKVTLRWWTHTAGGITDRDVELAGRSDELAAEAS